MFRRKDRAREELVEPTSTVVEAEVRERYQRLRALDEELRDRFERLLAHERAAEIVEEMLDRTRGCLEANEDALSNRVIEQLGRAGLVGSRDLLGHMRGHRIAVGRYGGHRASTAWVLSREWQHRIDSEKYAKGLYHDITYGLVNRDLRESHVANLAGPVPIADLERHVLTRHNQGSFGISIGYGCPAFFTVDRLLDCDDLGLDEERRRLDTLCILFHEDADGIDRLRTIRDQLDDRIHNTTRRISAVLDVRSRLEHDEDIDAESEDGEIVEIEDRWRRMGRAIEEMDLPPVEREA